jgi:hypothetical protein
VRRASLVWAGIGVPLFFVVLAVVTSLMPFSMRKEIRTPRWPC